MSAKTAITVSRARMYEVIRAPLITEKDQPTAPSTARVTFRVSMDATKPEIKQAVEACSRSRSRRVNTVTVKGKAKLFKGRPGIRSDWKKAIVLAGRGSQDRP